MSKVKYIKDEFQFGVVSFIFKQWLYHVTLEDASIHKICQPRPRSVRIRTIIPESEFFETIPPNVVLAIKAFTSKGDK